MSMKVNIPQPCNEDWSRMWPQGDGRLCLSCNKVVTDFTHMTPIEIQDYLNKHRERQICGIFNIADTTIEKPDIKYHIEKVSYLSFIRNLLASTILGTLLMLSSCKTKQTLTGKVSRQHVMGGLDSDGDGFSDIDDECPYVPGKPEHFGCPDSDNDGIGDSRDKCPFEPGLQENNGCPKINEAEPPHLMGIPQPPKYPYLHGIEFQNDEIFKEDQIAILKDNVEKYKKYRPYKSTYLKITIANLVAQPVSIYEKRKKVITSILKDYGVSERELKFKIIKDDTYSGKVYFEIVDLE